LLSYPPAPPAIVHQGIKKALAGNNYTEGCVEKLEFLFEVKECESFYLRHIGDIPIPKRLSHLVRLLKERETLKKGPS
jgi:hypothetical protein